MREGISTVSEAYREELSDNLKAGRKLDRALKSDAFWWGSWYCSWRGIGLIEEGAYAFVEAVSEGQGVSEEQVEKVGGLYRKVVLVVLEWEYKGKVEERIHSALTCMGIFRKRLKTELFDDDVV